LRHRGLAHPRRLQGCNLVRAAKSAIDALAARKTPNEAQTEEDLVYPLLELVGGSDKDVQPNASVKARNDDPDALLFGNGPATAAAGKLDAWQRSSGALSTVRCVGEAAVVDGRMGRLLQR
jgi:hypothetical protein